MVHFENAVKKHRFIKVNKNLSSNLKKWPKKADVGKWYELTISPKSDSNNQPNRGSEGTNTTTSDEDDYGQVN